MRRIMVASTLSLMVALMVALPVSAEDLLITEVDDAEGDLPYYWDSETGDAMTEPRNGNQLWCEYEYFDMTHYYLSKDLETNTFTFGMTLAADFPEPGDPMPNGVQRIDWLVWFDREPFNWVLSPEVTTEYMLNLTFDGTKYSCSFVDYFMMYGDVIETLVPNIDGTEFSTSFSGELVGDISDVDKVEFYWTVCIRVIHGTNSCLWADWTDWYEVDGQVWGSIPWPPVVEP